MTISATVAQGAIAPEAFVLVVTPASTGVDLSTVTSATLFVRRPDSSSTTWATTLSALSSGSVTVTHAYAANDVALLGLYQVYAKLTVPSGTVRTTSVQLTSIDPFVQ